MRASVIIRTYNEERYLGDLLRALGAQSAARDMEVILVDSGSTDSTQQIAQAHGCHIVHIEKSRFSFGRSLNIGCEAATGEALVFISGHCVPVANDWLARLTEPLARGASISYGRQLGGPNTRFSEHQVFAKYFPATSEPSQVGFFVNNANAAVLRSIWERYRFDESLTGLEDMFLGKQVVADGGTIAYVADAPVFHHHHEDWQGIKRRYEREAIALRHIMPEVHVSFSDFLKFFVSAIVHDLACARAGRRSMILLAPEIIGFRLAQFWGAYVGNHETRQLSQQRKQTYFYPK